MKRVQIKFHRTGIYDVCKTSFSCFDEKRIFDDGISGLAYFHKDIIDWLLLNKIIYAD